MSDSNNNWSRFADPANWHPAANLYPRMSEAELHELNEDIAAHDLRNPIVLIEENGKTLLLDGRNRMLSMTHDGEGDWYDEDFIVWKPDSNESPVDYVVSQNTHRRHLTPSQLADVAAKIVLLMEKNETSSNVTGHKTTKESPGANLHPEPRKNEIAAKMVGGVSPRSVADAVVVRKADPALADKVASGEVKVSNAKKIVQGKKSVVASQDVLPKKKTNRQIERETAEQERIKKDNINGDWCSKMGEALRATKFGKSLEGLTVDIGYEYPEQGYRLIEVTLTFHGDNMFHRFLEQCTKTDNFKPARNDTAEPPARKSPWKIPVEDLSDWDKQVLLYVIRGGVRFGPDRDVRAAYKRLREVGFIRKNGKGHHDYESCPFPDFGKFMDSNPTPVSTPESSLVTPSLPQSTAPKSDSKPAGKKRVDFTDADMVTILDLYKTLSQAEIAKRYGVSQPTMGKVIYRAAVRNQNPNWRALYSAKEESPALVGK